MQPDIYTRWICWAARQGLSNARHVMLYIRLLSSPAVERLEMFDVLEMLTAPHHN